MLRTTTKPWNTANLNIKDEFAISVFQGLR